MLLLHLVGFLYYFTYIDDARSNTNQVFIKILLVGAALFQLDGQTGTAKLLAPVGNFAYAPKTFASLKLILI